MKNGSYLLDDCTTSAAGNETGKHMRKVHSPLTPQPLSSSALSTQKSGIELTFIHEPSAAGLLPIDTMPHEEIHT